jgi:hypothetical protein
MHLMGVDTEGFIHIFNKSEKVWMRYSMGGQ